MTATKQKQIIREHYDLDRNITDQELADEIASLARKKESGRGFDDMDSILAAKLHII